MGRNSNTTGAAPTVAPENITSAAPTVAPESNKGTVATTPTDPWKVKKTIFVPPKAGKHQPDLVVSVNGKTFPIPRGKEWPVPLPIYEHAMRVLKNEQSFISDYYKIQQDLINKAKEEAATLE